MVKSRQLEKISKMYLGWWPRKDSKREQWQSRTDWRCWSL